MYEEHLNQKKKELDWPLLSAALGLVVVGVFFVLSASGEAAQELPLYKQKYFQQIIWCAAGVGAGAAVCWVDYGKWARWSRVIYWGAIASLLAVFVIGVVHKGGRRWISMGSFSLQPSEFAKIAFILLMADFLSRPVEELRQPRVFFAALGYTALPFVLKLSSFGFRWLNYEFRNDPPVTDRMHFIIAPKLFITAEDQPALADKTLALFDAAPQPKRLLRDNQSYRDMSDDDRKNYESQIVNFFLEFIPPSFHL